MKDRVRRVSAAALATALAAAACADDHDTSANPVAVDPVAAPDHPAARTLPPEVVGALDDVTLRVAPALAGADGAAELGAVLAVIEAAGAAGDTREFRRALARARHAVATLRSRMDATEHLAELDVVELTLSGVVTALEGPR